MNVRGLLRWLAARVVYPILGKDPEAIIVSFLTGADTLPLRMLAEIRALEPGRRHFAVGFEESSPGEGVTYIRLSPDSAWSLYRKLRAALGTYRIGLAPVLFSGEPEYGPLRTAAWLFAPRKLLAYNAKLERHHLQVRSGIASYLFLRGVALDRIFLRPKWLCPWKKDRSEYAAEFRILDGRPLSTRRQRVAVLSPHFPYPLSHGGAVRMFNLLRRASREFDIFLFAFEERSRPPELRAVLEFCAKVVLVPTPRYREPRWSSLLPPEIWEYRAPVMVKLIDQFRGEFQIALLQVEYTHLASYYGDVLVAHDVVSDLYRQLHLRERSLSSWWNYWRWRRFETGAAKQYRSVVVMSEKDRQLLALQQARVIPNGVDLERFQPKPETGGENLLFVGSFAHFPNIIAYRFFIESVWPLLRDDFPDMRLTVVAGPDPGLYWRAYSKDIGQPDDPRVQLLGFIADVRPLYVEANLVLVPTMVSAGTNIKVLEAMSMERAVISTSSGCAGLSLEHGKNIWIADDAQSFADGVSRLIRKPELRFEIAHAARKIAEECFGWTQIGEEQRTLWRELLTPPIVSRPATEADLPQLAEIEAASFNAAHWESQSFLNYECRVATVNGRIAGFLVSRQTAPEEREILNLAVHPHFRRIGVARRLLEEEITQGAGSCFLEVRESNRAARNLYISMGFREIGFRHEYYENPCESAIVMNLK